MAKPHIRSKAASTFRADAFVRPAKAQQVPFEVTSPAKRLASWNPTAGSINASVLNHVANARRKSHDQVLKNPYAGRALDCIVQNVIGTGIRPQPSTTDEGFNADLEALWEDWVSEADADQVQDFYGLQALALRAVVESGEVFVRHRFRRPEDGLLVPYQLQVIEPEHCPVDKTEQFGEQREVRGGIEFDGIGRRTAYWLTRYHPGDVLQGISGNEPRRVPASEIVHVFRPYRPGQIRGYPWLVAAMVRLYELDVYEDAELVRKKIASMMVGYITSPEVDASTGAIQSEAVAGEPGVGEGTMVPGSVTRLDPGEDVKFNEPTEVGSSFEPFLRHFLRSFSLPAGITYEQLTNDLSGVNFSSIRAGLIEARRGFEMIQRNLIEHQLCRPIYRTFLSQVLLSGAIRVPRAFREDRRQLLKCKWLAPGWEYVDPVKERQGELMDVRAGTTSRSELIRKRGKNERELEREIAADNARADELGLVFDSDPRKVTKTGVAQDTSGDAGEGDPRAAA